MEAAMQIRGPTILLCVALMLAVYLTSYLALMSPSDASIGSLGVCWRNRVPSYRVGGVASVKLFAPLQQVDRKLRPKYWSDVIRVQFRELEIPITFKSPARSPS
jgi:hypothetical protein